MGPSSHFTLSINKKESNVYNTELYFFWSQIVVGLQIDKPYNVIPKIYYKTNLEQAANLFVRIINIIVEFQEEFASQVHYCVILTLVFSKPLTLINKEASADKQTQGCICFYMVGCTLLELLRMNSR